LNHALLPAGGTRQDGHSPQIAQNRQQTMNGISNGRKQCTAIDRLPA